MNALQTGNKQALIRPQSLATEKELVCLCAHVQITNGAPSKAIVQYILRVLPEITVKSDGLVQS